MDVVRHKAVTPEVNRIVRAPFVDEIEIGLIVLVGEERLLSAVASLGDVVRVTRRNGSRYPCHNKGMMNVMTM